MAMEAMKKLEDHLTCSICLDTYTDPKQLQCSHVFCKECLDSLLERQGPGEPALICPVCRHPTPASTELQPAFHINRLLDIQASFDHVKASLCPLHCDKELDLYCGTCEELICSHCALKGGKHQNHDYEVLAEAFEEFKGEITSSFEPIERQMFAFTDALVQLDACCGEISNQHDAIKAVLRDTFRQLREVLERRETELIGQLDQITHWKLKSLAVQKDQIETIQAQLGSCLAFVKHSLLTGSQGDVLRSRATIARQVRELATPIQPEIILEPAVKADMMFFSPPGMSTVCQKYGQVSAPGFPDPMSCHASGDALEMALIGEESKVTLEILDFKKQACKEPVRSLESEFVSKAMGSRVSCCIEGMEDGRYEISYQPTTMGKHQLHIKVEGQHISGSPFSVDVVENMEGVAEMCGPVEKPWGVALNRRGEVLVTEWEGNCVSVFSRERGKLRSFGTCGSGQGQFQNPRGVAVDSEGNVLVVDLKNHRIQKFSADDCFLGCVGGRETGDFSHPRGISFNPRNGKIYVTDNHRVQILSSDLTVQKSFGTSGSGKGQFSHPWGIACDSSGKVYVADCGNNRIQVFTAEGKFVRMIGRSGELRWPVGVAVDPFGMMVYVSERYDHRISVFDRTDGGLVTAFGKEGRSLGEFQEPIGLALDDSGVLYVCDSGNKRIQVFECCQLLYMFNIF